MAFRSDQPAFALVYVPNLDCSGLLESLGFSLNWIAVEITAPVVLSNRVPNTLGRVFTLLPVPNSQASKYVSKL